MTTDDLVTRYIAFRRTLGGRYVTSERVLRAFGRVVGPGTPVARIRPGAVAAFLNGTGPITSAWHVKYHALNGFFQFAVSRGHRTASPMPSVVPKHPPRFVPHIYTRDELRRLLDAVPAYRRHHRRIEPDTFRAILLTLYGAGLRVREALNLTVADVDLTNGILTVRGTKFFKSRLVPIGRHLVGVLAGYAGHRRERSRGDTGDRFFVGRGGGRVGHGALDAAFQKLRAVAGVRRSDGARYQPRLHDLRHTFAVHRLTAWYQQGADVQRLVYHLSVYLGHGQLASTQVYLTMTPELLAQANARFERYARGEGDDA